MKLPKKPVLSTLKGCTVLSPNIREGLGIDEGVLVGEVKNWSSVEHLVSKYFDHVENYDMKGDGLFNITIETLEDINRMKLIGESNKQQKKNGSERVVLINDKAIMVPQAKLLMDYCKSLKTFLSSPTIKTKFLYKYAKAREAKQKDGQRIRREEEEKEEEAKLLHNGKMIAYLAAENGSSEIQGGLRSRIVQEKRKKEKGKERATEEDGDERRSKPRTLSPVSVSVPADGNVNEISFVTTSSGGTYDYSNNYVDENDGPMLAYIISFDELTPITEEDLFSLGYISDDLSMDERLKMSGITFIDSINDGCFLPDTLDDDVTNMINKFIRATEYHTKDMLLSPTKIEHINIVTLLNSSFFNKCKEDDVSQYNYRNYELPEQLKNMENDFKIKYVVNFVNAVFDVNDNLVVYWDTPLDIYKNSNMQLQRRQTTDASIKTVDGVEIGVVEIKPFNTPSEKIEEDRIRLAEISKKMLHRRILAAKDEKELATFAIMISGIDIEYFIHEYKPQKSTVASGNRIDSANRYTFRLLKKSILPTFPHTFSRMLLSLESLAHYKKMIIKSMASASDIEKPYLYIDSHKDLKPTVTLIKLDDK